MRELTLNYLDKVEEEVSKFVKDRIKHDFLKPDRELTLDLTVKEAEILITANPDVRAFADKGDLRALHEKCKSMQEKVDADFLKVRDLIDRIIQQVEEKENGIYDQMEELGITKIRRHGTNAGLFDTLGLSSGNPSISNFTLLEAFMDKTPEGRQEYKNIHQRLHSYMGAKYRALDAKADILKDFITKIAG